MYPIIFNSSQIVNLFHRDIFATYPIKLLKAFPLKKRNFILSSKGIEGSKGRYKSFNAILNVNFWLQLAKILTH